MPRAVSEERRVAATKTRSLPVMSVSDCCPGGLAEPLDRTAAESVVGLLKAVADPARLQLLSLIRSAEGQEACVCDLTDAVGLSQPTVSHHLRVLTDAGLLTRERRGTWAWFSVVPERLDELSTFFA
jgi:ArsR family transcriptional regulator